MPMLFRNWAKGWVDMQTNNDPNSARFGDEYYVTQADGGTIHHYEHQDVFVPTNQHSTGGLEAPAEAAPPPVAPAAVAPAPDNPTPAPVPVAVASPASIPVATASPAEVSPSPATPPLINIERPSGPTDSVDPSTLVHIGGADPAPATDAAVPADGTPPPAPAVDQPLPTSVYNSPDGGSAAPDTGAPATPAADPAPAAGGAYTVVHGDTMWDIAKDHGMSLQQLEALNPQIANPSLIYPGEQINLGGAPDASQRDGAAAFPTTSSYQATTTSVQVTDHNATPAGWTDGTSGIPADPTKGVISATAPVQTDPMKIHEDKRQES